MIKEKFELLRKHGKKVVAGLLAAAMTIEQVPLEGTGGWLQSLAATGITNNEKVPGMFADIDNVRLVGGTETKERFLMLQKKTRSAGAYQADTGWHHIRNIVPAGHPY